MPISRRDVLGGGIALAAAATSRALGSRTGAATSAPSHPASARHSRSADVTRPVGPLESKRANQLGQPAGRFPGDPGTDRLYWGSSSSGGLANWFNLDKECGSRLGLCRRYYLAGEVGRFGAESRTLHAAGVLNVASFKVPGNNWAAVAAGKQDAWLHAIATAAAQQPNPVYVCLHHEPNNDGSPTVYRAMYEHAAPILHQASNLVLTPIFNGFQFASDKGWQPWDIDVADVSGIDLYPHLTDSKTTMVARYTRAFDNLHTFGKPILLCEWGCQADRDKQGAYAPQMFADLYDCILSRNDVFGASYWDCDRRPRDGDSPFGLSGDRLTAFEACAKRSTSVLY